jgi:hypothetical protein
MIGKAGLGSYAKGMLEYCYYEKELTRKQRKELSPDDVRGELIYIQHLGIKTLDDGRLDLDYLAKQLLDNMDKNRNLTKFMWHQSFSFPPGERPSNDLVTHIATEFAKEFGFETNQMLVFKHEDTAHSHFHILANRINYNGKNTADHFNNYARTGKFCRRIELELGLTITAEMRLTQENKKQIQIADKAILKLKEMIDLQIAKGASIEQLKKALQKQGYKTYIGRGIAFYNIKNGMKVKGSDIGRDYSLSAIENKLNINNEQKLNPQLEKKQTHHKQKGLGL